ncbi:Methylmalonyl-CoA carboxyltransferase 12S subunit [Posidoniimonas polymericola]|uniref:Methylmalonyl-CoA carboxyltransferase 12S subunit n=1 Tax=Posidoniimonas polymericola TaxID=2528002 RepID=A0A5C5XUM8_9BACT|nr:acyl-CoA carboxylase subunit beta [Posidoniimonas polymericola]TWT66967.1 Methylmalonyl-CoA carboxyltransferase 12S subunit [Posidoniimonas polymericola]
MSPTTTEKPAPPANTMHDKINELYSRRAALHECGGAERVAKQHKAGKLSARERVDALLDEGSFQEQYGFARHRCTYFGMADKELPADGVVTGCGTINGRLVHLASQDFTVAGGAAGEVHSDKVVAMMSASLKTGSPFVFVNDSGGARIQEGIDSLAAYGRVFYHNTLLSGVVPQISLICGPCAGGAAYSPALTDFIIQTKHAQMFITGPGVIKQVTGQDVSADELGGAAAHMAYSGVVHFIADNDQHAAQICQKLLGLLPSNNMDDPPIVGNANEVRLEPALREVLPENARVGYDMHAVISQLVDDGDFLEVQAQYAENLIVGFGRVLGKTVGIIANQPNFKAGCLDIDASDKGARFIRFCNAFNIPLVTLVDVPGFMPGVEQEYGGIIRHGAKLLFAYSAATVPKITVILRKAYGGAYVAMCAKDLGADRVAAWPTAEIAVMGAEGATDIVFRKELASAEDKVAKRAELAEVYRSTFSNPYVAAGRGMVDDVIDPAETRRYVALSLASLRMKRDVRPAKKHGLIPL